jgi:hypothetical protein
VLINEVLINGLWFMVAGYWLRDLLQPRAKDEDPLTRSHAPETMNPEP